MKFRCSHIAATVAISAAIFIRADSAPAAQTAPKPVVASVESRWSEVYCDLTQLALTNPSELSVRYQYRNLRKTPFALPHTELVPSTRVFDPASKTLFGVLKDPDGKPISSTMLDGSLSRAVPAGGAQAHWVRLEPPGAGVKSITVLVEGCLPFSDVAIGAAATTPPLAKPATALAGQDGEAEGLSVEITRLSRGAGGLLDLVVRYKNGGTAVYRLPSAASPKSRISTTYLLDPSNRQKYEIVRDNKGRPLNSDSIEYGGGSLGENIAPGTSISFWAMFPTPPETTKTVSVYLPLAPPFDGVAISGTGAASPSGGSAVAGSVIGLDAALKDLGAAVTDSEIRIQLAADVLFDFDKAEIKKEAEPSLQKVATVLNANAGATVTIEGHTDGRGADDYNQKLSEARATSVKQWLVANAKVNGASLTTRGAGKSKPVAQNTKPDGADNPEGRAKNRRVEIVVRKGA